MSNQVIEIRYDQFLELEKIGIGAFHPLNGFMTELEFNSVCENLRLPNGDIFPLPVILDLSESDALIARSKSEINLLCRGQLVGALFPKDFYQIDREAAALKLFGTNDLNHPGVSRFSKLNRWFVGGKVDLFSSVNRKYECLELTPHKTKNYFKKMGWKTIVGFQTRNVPHRAHEYLQRIALEHVDGLFIQPLVGQKKNGDYTEDAIVAGYNALIEGFFPKNNVLLGLLTTSMRYAGPREAIFHALIRRNYGCTHFIVGRDHAGVGGYYKKYEAHELLRRYEAELGIEIMYLYGPYYCRKCDGIVTEHTCPHYGNENDVVEISGTMLRALLVNKEIIDSKYLRPEIYKALQGLRLFIDEENDVY